MVFAICNRTMEYYECNCESRVSVLVFVSIVAMLADSGVLGLTPRAPNFPYFERPNYRYPYYDENGRGKLLYGFGGPDLYQYKSYSPLEGIH